MKRMKNLLKLPRNNDYTTRIVLDCKLIGTDLSRQTNMRVPQHKTVLNIRESYKT